MTYCTVCHGLIVNGMCSNPSCGASKLATDKRVDHPPHYNEHPSGVECITIVEHMSFNLGNSMKYIWRADLKHGGDLALEDLKKAKWYLEREIEKRLKQ